MDESGTARSSGRAGRLRGVRPFPPRPTALRRLSRGPPRTGAAAPQLYLAIGTSGRFNHAVGFRNAGTVVAVDRDPAAPIFDVADLGIVGDWREVVPRLVEAIAAIDLED